MYKEVFMGFVGVIFLMSTPFNKPAGFITLGEVLIFLIGLGLFLGGGYLVEKNRRMLNDNTT